MNAAVFETPPIAALPWDSRRGSVAMLLFIATEAMLFVALFFSYFFIASGVPHWPMDEPPKLTLALLMAAILLVSSAVIDAGERASRQGHLLAARAAVGATLLLAIVFVVLQVLEYRDHLRTLRPTTDAYGSIFYAITSFHALHVFLGMLMLAYVFILPDLEGKTKPPHRPLHNAALYWHFVDAVWLFVVALIYLLPHAVRHWNGYP
jgi:cytochrome c oxidase subunit 3/cytochrome c oxidase subunit I+III